LRRHELRDCFLSQWIGDTDGAARVSVVTLNPVALTPHIPRRL
jgi:hypothetical protein